MLSLYCRTQTLCFVIICSAEDLLTLNSDKFRMVHKVDGNPQFDSRDWSMYSNILKLCYFFTSCKKCHDVILCIILSNCFTSTIIVMGLIYHIILLSSYPHFGSYSQKITP